jgi:hypothetical protein
MRTSFWLESLKRRDHVEDVGVGGIILKWKNVDWFHMAQYRDQ